MRLDGKIVLVTGATSGIGAAIADACATAGATLMLTGRSAERGNHTLNRVQTPGGQAHRSGPTRSLPKPSDASAVSTS
jgi:NAD(P)-dependent dehydrogenase (short-subunit alcohol dehydrogenase family)